MQEKITIKRTDINNINLELYINDIIKKLFNDTVSKVNTYENSNINEIITNQNKKIIMIFPKIINLVENKFQCIIDNIMYEYYITFDNFNIYATLREIKFTNNTEEYHITFIGNSKLINIKNKTNAIELELEEYNVDKEILLEKIRQVSVADNLIDIYNKIEPLTITPTNSLNSLKIKKYTTINSNYNIEKVTDLIHLYNNNLLEFMITINKNNKTYIIKKDNNNYNITLVDAKDNGITNFYFDINNEAEFIKHLEKKNKN